MRRVAWAALAFALGAVGWLAWSQTPSPPPLESRARPGVASPEALAAPQSAPPVIASPARSTTLAPMILPGCPDMDSQPIAPSLADSANVLMAELWDRARLLLRTEEGSPELRGGLVALIRGDPERGIELLGAAPDRRMDGFDVAAAAAFAHAVRALSEDRDPSAAIALLEHVEAEGPLAPLAMALAARQRKDDEAELSALTLAFQRGDDPAVAFALGSTAMRQGHSALALQAMRAYLVDFPDDEWAQAMEPVLERRSRLEARMEETRRDGVTLRYPPALHPERAEAVHDRVLAGLRDAAALLGGERRPTLTVILYPDRAAFRRSTCGPMWSGGIYDGSLRLNAHADPADLAVTVRHESLHAQLAHTAPRAPLWLHEGLAQVFQERVPRDLARTLRLMATERTYVPFPSLEGSFMVIEDESSARFAYHQSYAMVAAILEREGNASLHRAVQHLQRGGDPRDLIDVMTTRPFQPDDLLAWLDSRQSQ